MKVDGIMCNREKRIDIARGFAMVAVIVGHITGGGGYWKILYSFHLPLFFMISGYLFSYKNDFKNFLVRKSKCYLIPYICCMLINTTILYFMKEALPFHDIKQFLLQIRFPTLWFLLALYTGMIFLWVIFKICKQRFEIILIVCVLVSMAAFGYEEYFKTPLPWNIDMALAIQLYLAVGYGIKKFKILDLWNQQSGKKKIVEILLLVIMSVICTFGNYFLCHEAFMMAYSEFGLLFLTIPAGCLMSFAILFFSTWIKDLPLLEWVGKNSFCFFAFHKTVGIIPIYSICNVLGIQSRMIRGATAFVGSLLVCSIIYMLIADSKVKFLIGK